MTGGNAIVIWLIVAIVLSILEGVTVQLVSIWFAVGTIPAMIVAGFGGDIWLQMLVFLVASLLVLILGRPLLTRKLKVKRKATNADRVIGMTGIVQEEINNLQNKGRVSANGLEWTARTPNDETIIPAESKVKVLEIDGVKLIVEPLDK